MGINITSKKSRNEQKVWYTLDDIRKCGSMHEDYNADTGEPLAPTAAQPEHGLFTGFVGWNLLVQQMLEQTCFHTASLLDLD